MLTEKSGNCTHSRDKNPRFAGVAKKYHVVARFIFACLQLIPKLLRNAIAIFDLYAKFLNQFR